MPLNIGQMVEDRYRVVKLLGQGGMGAVYRTWDMRLNRLVALKEMMPQSGLDVSMLAQLRQQFQQEAQVLAMLDHSSLVRVNDCFSWQGNEYLAMDFVEGESLADRIQREGAQPEAQVLAWVGQLLDALTYCHERGVLHRDIKPQNIIITPEGKAVLVDFGLVKLWDPQDPRTRTVMRGAGTPEYAPPEQYDMGLGHTDPRSDIYGLGATIYHALTGQAPPTATQRMANPSSFMSPRRINAAVSSDTEAVVLKSLEMAMERRYQSAEEMALALGFAPRQFAVTPRHIIREGRRGAPPTEMEPPKKRKRGILLGLGGAGLAVVGLLCLALVAGAVLILPAVGQVFSGINEGLLATLTAEVTATSRPATATSIPPTRTPSPTQPPPTPTQPPTDETVTLTVYNDSSETVCFIYISPSTSDTWGEDWLGDDVIVPGDIYNFDVPAGTYDLEADDCDGNALDTQVEVDLSEPLEWTFTDAGEGAGLDFTLAPTFGEVELSPGFTPDPFTVDLFSGGVVDVEVLDLGVDCVGYAASAPDFNLYLSDDSGDLRIFFVADGGEDATLIINDPYADWVCNDDAPGDTLDPMIEFEDASSGWYAIWVGSYSSDEAIVGTLYITEMDYHPESLPEGESSSDGGELDFTLEPTFGEVELSPGFTPDPFTVDLFSGDTVDVLALDMGDEWCGGYDIWVGSYSADEHPLRSGGVRSLI